MPAASPVGKAWRRHTILRVNVTIDVPETGATRPAALAALSAVLRARHRADGTVPLSCDRIERIDFDIDNPTGAPATVYLYEEPIGGVVRNSYVVDGTLVEVGCARLSRRYQVTAFTAAPGATTLHVLTMPDGGSNYPVEIGVTTAPVLPSTPPMSAPDGCFPKPGGPSPQPSAAPPPPLPSPVPT